MRKEILISYFPKITFRRYSSLLKHFGTLDSAFLAEFSDFKGTLWEENIIHEFLEWKESVEEQKLEIELERYQIQSLALTDPEYPLLLKEIYDPPICLFVRGSLKDISFPLGVVGTRKNSLYGKQITEQIIHDLVQNGITIVSGLARGIDGIAHASTLESGGKTIAVLGTGIDDNHIYPKEHQPLAQKIITQAGAIVSEYPPGMQANSYTFPRRNRIIAGMTLGTLVIEAPLSSGSLITAQYALDSNREVFAIPQNINAQNSGGPNTLLKNGAHLITTAQDILEVLNIESSPTLQKTVETLLATPNEKILLKELSLEPTHIDAIIQKSGLPSQVVNSTLTLLEMNGKVKNLGGMNYILN